MGNNLFLIGMMGSWKSTVGKKMASALNMKFIDIDDAIEEITNMNVSDIFNEFGEKRFREMESAFFIEKAKQKGYIFSTGGGIVLQKPNRDILRKQGTCFFLNASPYALSKRIHNTSKRPLLEEGDKLEDRLQTIWDKRKQLYIDCANFTINTDDMNPNQVLNEILKILEDHIADN